MTDTLTPTQIIGLIMYKTGKTIPLFSKDIGISKSTLYLTINGIKTRDPARDLVADAVGMKKEELWPEAAITVGK